MEMQFAVPESAEKQIITATALIAKSEEAVIENDDQLETAVSLRAWIQTTSKNLEEQRTAVTGPINQALRTLNGRFKEVSDPLDAAKKKLDGKIALYMEKREEQKRAEAEEEARKSQEEKLKLAEELEMSGDTEGAEAVLEEAAETLPAATKSSPARGKFGGSVSMRTTMEAELDESIKTLADLSKIPAEYLLPLSECVNWKVVRAAISGKNGKRDIPGLRIYEKKSVVGR